MQFLNQKKGFLGFDAKFNIKDKVIIVPFGLEKTVSYGVATKIAISINEVPSGLARSLKQHSEKSES